MADYIPPSGYPYLPPAPPPQYVPPIIQPPPVMPAPYIQPMPTPPQYVQPGPTTSPLLMALMGGFPPPQMPSPTGPFNPVGSSGGIAQPNLAMAPSAGMTANQFGAGGGKQGASLDDWRKRMGGAPGIAHAADIIPFPGAGGGGRGGGGGGGRGPMPPLTAEEIKNIMQQESTPGAVPPRTPTAGGGAGGAGGAGSAGGGGGTQGPRLHVPGGSGSGVTPAPVPAPRPVPVNPDDLAMQIWGGGNTAPSNQIIIGPEGVSHPTAQPPRPIPNVPTQPVYGRPPPSPTSPPAIRIPNQGGTIADQPIQMPAPPPPTQFFPPPANIGGGGGLPHGVELPPIPRGNFGPRGPTITPQTPTYPVAPPVPLPRNLNSGPGSLMAVQPPPNAPRPVSMPRIQGNWSGFPGANVLGCIGKNLGMMLPPAIGTPLAIAGHLPGFIANPLGSLLGMGMGAVGQVMTPIGEAGQHPRNIDNLFPRLPNNPILNNPILNPIAGIGAGIGGLFGGGRRR